MKLVRSYDFYPWQIASDRETQTDYHLQDVLDGDALDEILQTRLQLRASKRLKQERIPLCLMKYWGRS